MGRTQARREFLCQRRQHRIVDSHLAQMRMRLQHVIRILARTAPPLPDEPLWRWILYALVGSTVIAAFIAFKIAVTSVLRLGRCLRM